MVFLPYNRIFWVLKVDKANIQYKLFFIAKNRKTPSPLFIKFQYLNSLYFKLWKLKVNSTEKKVKGLKQWL